MPARPAAAAALVILCLTLPACAAPAALVAGDDAPRLRVGRWIAGPAVENLDRGKVYVVELWGTWNAQYRATLPRLADVARRFADVRFLAVSVNQDDDAPPGPRVGSLGDAVAGLSIAADDDSPPPLRRDGDEHVDDADPSLAMPPAVGSTTRDWWQASGADVSPVAMIVNADGVIAWIGKATRVEAPLKQVLDGTFDLAAARRAGVEAADVREQLRPAYVEFATGVSQLPQPADTDAQLALIDALVLKYPGAKVELLSGFDDDGGKFNLLLAAKRYDEAYRVADDACAAAAAQGKAAALNRIAWQIVDPERPIDRPDVARAKRFAELAVEASDATSGAILDTLARAQFLAGEFHAAVASEEKAAALCDEPERELVEACLKQYRDAAATRPAK